MRSGSEHVLRRRLQDGHVVPQTSFPLVAGGTSSILPHKQVSAKSAIFQIIFQSVMVLGMVSRVITRPHIIKTLLRDGYLYFLVRSDSSHEHPILIISECSCYSVST
jgi:hypothetical protein